MNEFKKITGTKKYTLKTNKLGEKTLKNILTYIFL